MRIKAAKKLKYGEVKKPCQVYLTGQTLLKLDNVAESSGVTRSEYLEVILRREFNS